MSPCTCKHAAKHGDRSAVHTHLASEEGALEGVGVVGTSRQAGRSAALPGRSVVAWLCAEAPRLAEPERGARGAGDGDGDLIRQQPHITCHPQDTRSSTSVITKARRRLQRHK